MKLVDWNAAAINTLRTEWESGKSGAEIAAILGNGCTRMAVIGKVHRLNLPPRTTLHRKPEGPRTRPTTARPKPSEPAVVANGSFVLSSPMRRNEAAVRPPAPLAAPVAIRVRKVAKGKPCGILHLTGCKWPVGHDAKTIGQHVFCNSSREPGASYCADHAARVYAGKPLPRPRRDRGVWA